MTDINDAFLYGLVKKAGGYVNLNKSDVNFTDLNNLSVTSNGDIYSARINVQQSKRDKFIKLISTSGKALSGQHLAEWDDFSNQYKSLILPLSKVPAVLGICPLIGWKDYQGRLTQQGQGLSGHANNGGAICIDIHPANPFITNGTIDSAWVVNQDVAKPDLKKLLLSAPSSTAKINWWKQIDVLVSFFKQLPSDAVIIFRPFHESNGRHFWWGTYPGQPNDREQDLKNLTYDLKLYLQTSGVSNLIWAHSGTSAAWYAPNKYGRPDWVDMVGSSVYSDNGSFQTHPEYYDEMVATGKPIAFFEIGPVSGIKLDYNKNFLVPLKTKWNKVILWQAWQDNYSLAKNTNSNILLNDSWTKNLNDLNVL